MALGLGRSELPGGKGAASGCVREGESAPLRAWRGRPGEGRDCRVGGRGFPQPEQGNGSEFLGCSSSVGMGEVVFALGWLSGVGRGRICPRLWWGEAVFPRGRGTRAGQEQLQGAEDVFLLKTDEREVSDCREAQELPEVWC